MTNQSKKLWRIKLKPRATTFTVIDFTTVNDFVGAKSKVYNEVFNANNGKVVVIIITKRYLCPLGC